MKRVFLLLLLTCCLLTAPAAAAGGAGTAANPYIIETAAELQSMQNNLAAYYKLGNDIDLSGVSWVSIGSSGAPFMGYLDGNGFTISNLDSNNGLFNYISGGKINDLTLLNFKITSTTSTGSLCSFIISSNTIEFNNIICDNCNIYSSSVGVGGLIGRVHSLPILNIIDCSVKNSNIESSYYGTGYVGGLIGVTGIGGQSNTGLITITNSEILNNIICHKTIGNSVGGVVGLQDYSTNVIVQSTEITNCIIYANNLVGGFVGRSIDRSTTVIDDSIITDSTLYVTNSDVSGVICSLSGTSSTISNTNVLNCCIIGGYSAGIAYYGYSSITNCDVIDSNIYGSSVYHNIAPSGYDTTSTASGITNVPNRYLYASGLSYSTSGNTATITIDDRQGAAVIETSTGAAATDIIDYGDGNTGTTDTHTYAAGIYTAGVTLSNYLQTTPLSFYTTPINIGIPTYTANTITQQDADIVIDAGQLYQAQTQFVLPSTTSDLEFYADNVFVVASGNAVYLIDTATEQIEPVSNTTGTTAEKIYLGEHAAIITDIDGNTAVYQYAENSFDYLASGDNQQIATTQNHAGIIINGELNIYDLSDPRKIGDITASVSQLAGNDYADTFAGYSGTTFYYWWIDNGEIKSGSQTMPNPITEVKQIPQTQNYIITTEKNTITVSVSSIGEYSKLSTSATELPLTHVQATTIGVTIGVHAPNEIYIVGADGSTAGTYQTGATLNDASISKATGLYAITGGIDQQAYILRKDQSSTWALAQTIRANGALSHTQISTNGQYAAIVNGVNLYLLKLSTATDTTYYLQGVVISSTGSLYANKVITINGEKVTTDLSGRFTYAVTPGSLYRIVADTTTTEYTATNTVLQTIAIKLKPNPFAQSVSYSTDYNADTRNFEMTYTDTRDMTSSVTWVIRETGNQTIVSTQTVQAGQTAYWEVPLDKSFTSYQISMIADRQGTNVENTWIITPDGKNPINIPGLDETGKTILFGAVLMIFGGLFGVMHSTKGALLTVLLAGVFAYLGLLNIPTTVIMVAATLAVAALLAKGSGGS